MDFLKNNKFLVSVILILLAVISVYAIRDYRASKEKYIPSEYRDIDYVTTPRKYNVNEYSVVNVSNDKMAQLYLFDYIEQVRLNIEKTYDLLDEDYKLKKFKTKEEYINYVNGLNLENVRVVKYLVKNNGEITNYYIYDNYDNLYIFSAKHIMDYKIYFDDELLETR